MTDAFLLLIRWVHALAAVAWVGGGMFFWVVLRPAFRSNGVAPATRRFIGTEFGQMVTLAMWALVITGGILAFTRLSEQGATGLYGAILGVKVALSAWMFFVAINRARRAATSTPGSRSKVAAVLGALGHINMTTILGMVVYLLSALLGQIIESR